jgi:hypothetical protein
VINGMTADLAASRSNEKTDLQAAINEFHNAAQIEQYRIALRSLEEGKYVTLPEGTPEPSYDRGTLVIGFGATELESGGMGCAYVPIRPSEHVELREYLEASGSLPRTDRANRISDFNRRSEGERKAWFEQFEAAKQEVERAVRQKGQHDGAVEAQRRLRQFYRELVTLRAEPSKAGYVLLPR